MQRSPDGSSLYAASFEAGDDSENGDTFAVARMVMSPEKTEELASLVAATRREFRGSSGLTKLLVNYCDDHGEAGEMHSSPPVMSAAQQWQEAAPAAFERVPSRPGTSASRPTTAATEQDVAQMTSDTHAGEADVYGRRPSEELDSDNDPYEERLMQVLTRPRRRSTNN